MILDEVSMPQAALGQLQLENALEDIKEERFNAASGTRAVATTKPTIELTLGFNAASGTRAVATLSNQDAYS